MAVVVTEKPALKTGSLMTIISSKIDFLRLKTRLSSVEKKTTRGPGNLVVRREVSNFGEFLPDYFAVQFQSAIIHHGLRMWDAAVHRPHQQQDRRPDLIKNRP